MKTENKVGITLAILASLIFGFYFFSGWISKTTGFAIGEINNYSVKCFEKKAILYGLESCPYCQIQKKELGSDFKYITYVDCEKDISLCKGIKEIPAWKINNEVYYGLRSRDELKELAGC